MPLSLHLLRTSVSDAFLSPTRPGAGSLGECGIPGCAYGNSAAEKFTSGRKVPFLLITQCPCQGPGSALLLFFIFLQLGMRTGGSLEVQAQATILLTFPFLLHLPLPHFFSLPICSFSFSLSSSPHLPLWTKIPGKPADFPLHTCKSSGYSFLSLPVLHSDIPSIAIVLRSEVRTSEAFCFFFIPLRGSFAFALPSPAGCVTMKWEGQICPGGGHGGSAIGMVAIGFGG